jgi:rhodanese-related sulfurtransferase
MPIDQLKSRLAELPAGKTIVAYCRGPYCLMVVDAVFLLKQRGFAAIHLPEGVAEWGPAPVRCHDSS